MASSSENIDYARTANVANMHAAAAREREATAVGGTPVSLWVVVATGIVTIIAGAYFGQNTGSDASIANVKGYHYSLQYPEGSSGGGAAMSDEELRQDANWLAAGKAVYSGAGNCVGCHQASGEGVAGQFPPLKGSDWVTASDKRLIAILLYGIGGQFSVLGKTYNGQMPAQGTALNNKQIAQVASYIRNEWGNKAPLIYDDQVAAVKVEIVRQASWTEEELKAAIAADAACAASEWPAKIAKAAGGAAEAAPAAKK